MDIKEIKSRLSILQVLAHYGIKPDNHNQIRCPFHADDKPSCKIYPETGTYFCFGCGAKGDQIQFIQDKEQCSQHEAIKKAESMLNEVKSRTAGITGLPKLMSQIGTTKQPTTEPNYPELFQYFLQSIERSANAQQYCTSRGLDYKTLEIGYNSAEKWNKLKQCLIFPLKDKNGKITSLYGRRITESKGHALEYGKHYYSENRSGLYPCYPSPETETLIITEAVIDAATLLQCTDALPCVSILAAYGTNGLTKEHKQAIAELKQLKEIIFFFDGDTAGKEGIQRNAEELKAMVNCKLSMINCPEGEDVNSLLTFLCKILPDILIVTKCQMC